MTKSGLDKVLIIRKVKESKNNFDVSVPALVALKNSQVDEEIIAAMMDGSTLLTKKPVSNTAAQPAPAESLINETEAIKPIVNSVEALHLAKTIAITKSSLNPSRQALEKELLKRKEWQDLNLNIVRNKEGADLFIEIGFVPFSLITHRYVFHVYDNRSGTIICAGETTSWGSLSKNLAREISKKMNAISGGRSTMKTNSPDH